MLLGVPAVQSMEYSPTTLAEAVEIIPPGATVIINRWGGQLRMLRTDISLISMESSDPYDVAYGQKAWSEKELIDIIRTNNVKVMIFFLGREQRDPFLEKGLYGSAIQEAYLGHSPVVASVRKLSDGLILYLK